MYMYFFSFLPLEGHVLLDKKKEVERNKDPLSFPIDATMKEI